MDNPYAPPSSHDLKPESLGVGGFPFATASVKIDDQYAIACVRHIRQLRRDHRLRVWLRMFGIVLLPLMAWQAASQGNWFWVIVPVILTTYLLLSGWLANRFAIRSFDKARMLGSKLSMEFYEGGIVTRDPESITLIQWIDVIQAAFFHDGLLLSLTASRVLWIPEATLDRPVDLSDFVRANVRLDSRFKRSWS